MEGKTKEKNIEEKNVEEKKLEEKNIKGIKEKKRRRRRNLNNAASSKQKVNKNKNKDYEEKIKKIIEDENIQKVIRPKYNLILNFFDQLNNYVYLILFFAIIIALVGDKKVFPFIILILMILAIIVKTIVDYKSFKYTIYLLYKDKIVQNNIYLRRKKVLRYEDLKDIKYGNFDNSFAGSIFNLNSILFVSNKTRILNNKNIKIPNQPNDEEYREEIVRTIDIKYLEEFFK